MTLVLLLLVGGAAVNVAVAWGSALFASIPSTRGLDMPDAEDEAMWNGQRPDFRDSTVRMVAVSRTALLDTHFMIGNASRTLQVEFDDRGKVRSFGWSGTVDSRPYEWSMVVQSGWPMRSLCGSRWSGQWDGAIVSVQAALGLPHRADTAQQFAGAFLIARSGGGGTEHRLLPWGMLLRGFIVNTIFYALVLWLLIVMPLAARRALRRRRRLCVQCAYPIGTSAVCSECGAAVVRQETG